MAHLSQREKALYGTEFINADRNGNGTLDMKEFNGMCRSLGFDFSNQTVQNMFNQIDTNGDGKITLDEFLAAMPNKTSKDTREDANLRRSFNTIDKNNDGFLSALEVQMALNESGRNVTLEHAEKMVKTIGTDGRISLQEFLEYYSHHKCK